MRMQRIDVRAQLARVHPMSLRVFGMPFQVRVFALQNFLFVLQSTMFVIERVPGLSHRRPSDICPVAALLSIPSPVARVLENEQSGADAVGGVREPTVIDVHIVDLNYNRLPFGNRV
jgi:hypothetical protein